MDEWLNGWIRVQLFLAVKWGQLYHDRSLLPVYEVLTCINHLDELKRIQLAHPFDR